MIKISTLVYYVALIILCFVMVSLDQGISDWEYWVIIFCMITARTCGQIEGNN